jgi:hypothetical protein
MTTTFSGIHLHDLRRALDAGVDHGGNAIEPFVDHEGGWPLRCCLTDSTPGDRVAIISWSPFDWEGPYRETGPIVVHVDGCTPTGGLDRLPAGLDARAMTLRPYGPDRRIAYHRVQHVPAGSSVSAHVVELLEHDDVDVVHGRNVTGGCYAFTASRSR